MGGLSQRCDTWVRSCTRMNAYIGVFWTRQEWRQFGTPHPRPRSLLSLSSQKGWVTALFIHKLPPCVPLTCFSIHFTHWRSTIFPSSTFLHKALDQGVVCFFSQVHIRSSTSQNNGNASSSLFYAPVLYLKSPNSPIMKSCVSSCQDKKLFGDDSFGVFLLQLICIPDNENMSTAGVKMSMFVRLQALLYVLFTNNKRGNAYICNG